MNDKVKLVPNTGMKVRDPLAGDYLPEDGREVELTTYWRRRLRDGDVVVDEPRKKTTTRKTESPSQDNTADKS